MAQKSIGFGLVGTGMAGETQAKEFQHVTGGDMVAACSRNEANVREFAATYEIRKWYTDYEDLIRDPRVDVVCVLTPSGLHRDMAVAAAEAGKHVLIEKPLEINLRRADDIIRACKQYGSKLGVVFQMRFGSVARETKKVIEAGALGKIFLAEVIDKGSRTPAYYESALWRGTKELEGGGCLLTQSIHPIDLIQYLVGPVSSVCGHVATSRHAIEVEDTAAALFKFQNGAMGTIVSTTSIKPAMKSRLELHGEKGTIVVNAQYDKFLVWDVEDYPAPEPVEASFDFHDIDDPWAFPQTRHRVQLQDMVDAIREDRDPILSGEEARKSLAITMAIYESSKQEKEVSLLAPEFTPPAF